MTNPTTPEPDERPDDEQDSPVHRADGEPRDGRLPPDTESVSTDSDSASTGQSPSPQPGRTWIIAILVVVGILVLAMVIGAIGGVF